jgi:C4-dicarboxylate transporter DctM subunit
MNPVELGIILIVLVFVLIAIGLPVGFSMGVMGFVGVWFLISQNAAIAKISYIPFQVVTSYDIAVLPLFLLMAFIVFAVGLSRDLYNLASKWLGHLHGGIAIATVWACAGFAAVSASSAATSATMGLVAIPEMKKYNYQSTLATGCVAAGGTMGSLIPPSGMLIIYGLITETSIGRLFAAGIIPGILEAVFYMGTIYILCRWKPTMGPPGPRFSLKEKVTAFGSCGEIMALIVLVLGGLMIGWFTPTEAGAVAAIGAIIFSTIRKRLDWGKFKHALVETITTTGMIYCIMIGAMLFNYFVAVTTIPFLLSDFINGLPVPPLLIVITMMIIYIFLGCVMDPIAMILLTIPIFFPMIINMGFDPVWFGILLVRMTEIAGITPPIGMNVYIIAGVAPDVPLTTIFRGIIPFLIADILHVTLILLVPALVLFLPDLIF